MKRYIWKRYSLGLVMSLVTGLCMGLGLLLRTLPVLLACSVWQLALLSWAAAVLVVMLAAVGIAARAQR